MKKLLISVVFFVALTGSAMAQETQYQAAPAWDCPPDYSWMLADLAMPIKNLKFFVCLKYNHFLASSESILKNESLYSKNT